ncbi:MULTISPECIES: ABC transporter permease [Thermocrispum]|jgi:teichoic acid transport system permease protein|uniref:Transport permease protein n=1 Tax=Thermocrispum agreste TaxID=37925 RepID=A0A2W4KZR6_9PSEU|nr:MULTISPECIES: ABC transporter permease [Thermocrispum]PZM88776.1 MAG: ABC transporter permease [Thermocrispum agreste]
MPDTEQSAPKSADSAGDADDKPVDAAALAARYGLVQSTARPSLTSYVKQLWQRRQFILAYSAARKAQTYSSTWLGQIWQVLTPLMQAAVYYAVFGLLLRLSRGIEDYPAFLVTGVFVFTFMQRSMNNGAKSISGNLQMIRALHFPRAVLPLSFVLVEFQQLLVSMVVLFGFVLAVGVPISVTWLLVVPAMLLQMLFNMGLSLVMARIGATSSDINQLLPFITRVWFYLSGVFFEMTRYIKNLPDVLQTVLVLNPGAVFLDLYRGVLIDSHRPLELPWGLNVWQVSTAWAVVFFIGGFIFFWRREERYGRG